MGWGLGGRHALQVVGCRESEVSLRVVKRRYVFWLRMAQCLIEAMAWGMQRGRAASPLAKRFCTTKHILQCAYDPILILYYKDIIVLQRFGTNKNMLKFRELSDAISVIQKLYKK